jgi:hypothetical protein
LIGVDGYALDCHEKVFPALVNLTRLELINMSQPDDSIDYSLLPALRSLNLSGSILTEEQAWWLSTIPRLDELILADCQGLTVEVEIALQKTGVVVHRM